MVETDLVVIEPASMWVATCAVWCSLGGNFGPRYGSWTCVLQEYYGEICMGGSLTQRHIWL